MQWWPPQRKVECRAGGRADLQGGGSGSLWEPGSQGPQALGSTAAATGHPHCSPQHKGLQWLPAALKQKSRLLPGSPALPALTSSLSPPGSLCSSHLASVRPPQGICTSYSFWPERSSPRTVPCFSPSLHPVSVCISRNQRSLPLPFTPITCFALTTWPHFSLTLNYLTLYNYSFIQCLFIERLLCSRYCSRFWGLHSEHTDKNLCPGSLC